MSRAAVKRYLERRQRRFNSSSRAYNYPVSLKPELDFTHFKQYERGSLRVADTARPGVPGWASLKNKPQVAPHQSEGIRCSC